VAHIRHLALWLARVVELHHARRALAGKDTANAAATG